MKKSTPISNCETAGDLRIAAGPRIRRARIRRQESPPNLADPIFADEAAAYAFLESIRWPNGPVCPHCGSTDRFVRLNGSSARRGLLSCNACLRQSRVTVGTVYEKSHIPVRKWHLATFLIVSRHADSSIRRLKAVLGISYKSAWIMARRIRRSTIDIGVNLASKPDSKGVTDALSVRSRVRRCDVALQLTPAIVALLRDGWEARARDLRRDAKRTIPAP